MTYAQRILQKIQEMSPSTSLSSGAMSGSTPDVNKEEPAVPNIPERPMREPYSLPNLGQGNVRTRGSVNTPPRTPSTITGRRG